MKRPLFCKKCHKGEMIQEARGQFSHWFICDRCGWDKLFTVMGLDVEVHKDVLVGIEIDLTDRAKGIISLYRKEKDSFFNGV